MKKRGEELTLNRIRNRNKNGMIRKKKKLKRGVCRNLL